MNSLQLRLNRNFQAPAPKTIFLIVNGSCNAKCLMCDIGQRNYNSQFTKIMQRGEMSLTLLEKLIEEVRSWRPSIEITSTEPLLWANLIKAINIIKSAMLSVHITTNGILLPYFAGDLIKSKVDSICVSIDGPESIHDYIRGVKHAFKKAIEGIKLIQSGANKCVLKLRISSTITPLNQKHLYETAELINNLGIDKHSFTHMNFVTSDMAHIHNIQFPNYKVTESSVKCLDPKAINPEILHTQIKLIKKDFPHVELTPPLESAEQIKLYYHDHYKFIPGYSRCKAVWKAGQIAADGCLFGSTRCFDVPLGNVKDGFMKAWNGEKMRRFRKDLAIAGGAFKACARCCGIF